MRRLALPILALVFLGFSCAPPGQEAAQRARPFTLKYWTVFNEEEQIQPLIDAYRQLRPHVTVEFKKLRFEEYERMVLNGLAEDRGPDVLSLHHAWLPEWRDRLLPVPASMSVPFTEVSGGGLQNKRVITIREIPGMTVKRLRNDFVDTVAEDVIIATEQSDPRAPLIDRIYGLPLSVDSLALFSNRELLNAAGIARPASTWEEFQAHVKKLTALDQTGAIIRAGAAIGTADNVERGIDILAALMMQNGAEMTDANGMAVFDKPTPLTQDRPLPPGAGALVFYADFANPEKEVYTWNDKMPASFEAFIRGQAAYFFGYAYHIPAIRAASPRLRFAIAPFPQLTGDTPLSYANYWVESVAKKTSHPDEAWDFVQFITEAAQAQKYLTVAKKAAALRALVTPQLEDLDLAVFAGQAPYSRSWYHGTDAQAAEEAFKEMIRQARAGAADPRRIVELGATKVNQTIR